MSAEDKSRYDAQYKIVAQIVAMFEDPSYSDEDAEKGLKIVELMQEVRSRCRLYVAVAVLLACIPVLRFTAIHDRPRVILLVRSSLASASYLTPAHQMQEHGSPPAEIMGPLPPGFDLGADGLPKLPDGCTIA